MLSVFTALTGGGGEKLPIKTAAKIQLQIKKAKKIFKKNTTSGYWRFIFPEENIDKEINNCLHILKENRLTEEDSNGKLSLTPDGILIAAKRIKVETYLFLKTWINYSRKGEVSNLELLYLLSQTPDGKELPIPFYHSCINDYKKEKYKCEEEEAYGERILHLIFEQNEQHKKLYHNKIILKNCKECKEYEVFSLEEHLSFKKTLLLYDWIRGNKNVKTIEQEYYLYRGAIHRLGEGFSWLADSLAAIAENTGWKKGRKEDLNKIKLLSNRLILSSFPSTNSQPETCNLLPASCNPQPETRNPQLATSLSSPPPCNSQFVLEIDQRRPDRIIFEGKEVKVTAREFSLIHLLAQHNEQVMSYNELANGLWGDEKDVDAIYTRINYHICKIKKDILKIIDKKEDNVKKIRDIFKTVPGRGLMLDIKEKELETNS